MSNSCTHLYFRFRCASCKGLLWKELQAAIVEGKEVNMSSEVLGVMTIVTCNSCYPMEEKSRKKAKELLKGYVKDPDVNKLKGLYGEVPYLAPLHWAVILGSVELLDLFLQSPVVDINVRPGGGRRGNVLDMAARASKNIGLATSVEMVKKLLQVKELQICRVGMMTELTPRDTDVWKFATVLGEAVDQESRELLTVLLEAEANHPSLNIYSCLVYCMYKQKLALFKELLEKAKEQEHLYRVPNFKG